MRWSAIERAPRDWRQLLFLRVTQPTSLTITRLLYLYTEKKNDNSKGERERERRAWWYETTISCHHFSRGSWLKRKDVIFANEIDNSRVGRRGLTNRFIRTGNISRVSGPTRFIRSCSSIGIVLARRRVAAAPRSRQNARRGFNRN